MEVVIFLKNVSNVGKFAPFIVPDGIRAVTHHAHINWRSDEKIFKIGRVWRVTISAGISLEHRFMAIP